MMKNYPINITRMITCLVSITCLIMLQGCGASSDGPSRAKVSGKLTVDGQPVPGVEVNFLNPEHPDFGSYAVTDSEGNFRLVVGAVPGKNRIFFSKIKSGDIALNPDEGIDAGQLEAMAEAEGQKRKKSKQVEQIIPAEYTEATSNLTFVVPESGTDEANFDI